MALQDTIVRIMRLKPVRVFLHYASSNGPLMAQGLAYQAIFAVFAAIWVAFSVAGVIITANPDLQEALLGILASSVPGLIDDGSGTGAIDARQLFDSAGVLSWTGAIAAIGLIMTAIGWLASGRVAVRTLFGLDAPKGNPVLLKVKDLGLALGFGVAIMLSAAVTVFSTTALDWALDLIGLGSDSDVGRTLGRIVGLLIVLVFDTAVLAAFLRLVSGIRIPWRQLRQGAILGGVGLGVLKTLGSALLGGATSNPLLAGFAVIIGLLIWFNLICQVILVAASWVSVSVSDDDVDLSVPRKADSEPSGRDAAL